MGLRILGIRREAELLGARTRDRWGDWLRRRRDGAREWGSLTGPTANRVDQFKDAWAAIRAEGGLWVKNGRPRLLTHAGAALLLISATAAMTWQVAVDRESSSPDGVRASAYRAGRRQIPGVGTPKPIHATPVAAMGKHR